MKNCLFIFLAFIMLCSCEPKEIAFTSYDVKTDVLKNIGREINILNRTKLIQKDDEFFLLNLTKKNELLIINLSRGSYEKVAFDTSYNVLAVNYTLDECTMLTPDSILVFNTNGQLKDSYTSPLSKEDFVDGPLYEETIQRYGAFFFVQIGETGNGLNYVGEKIFLFFNKDTTFKKFDFPIDYEERYLHYTNVSTTHVEDHFFYIPMITNGLSKINFYTEAEKEIFIDQSGFLKFDTAKRTNVLYIDQFSTETKLNIRLLANESNIFLIQKTRTKKGKSREYKCIVFDHELNKQAEFKIAGKPDPGAISVSEEGVIFFLPKESKILVCSIKTN